MSLRSRSARLRLIAELIKDVEGVIKGLDYDRCILVGHDWGGAIAWSFAYAHPEMLFQVDNYRAIASAFIDSAIDKTIFTPQDLAAYKNAAAKPGALTAKLNYYRNIFPGLLNQTEPNVLEVPTLMIWGENDKFLGKELTYDTEDYLKDLQLHYIPQCSHWVQQEQPNLVNQYMHNFLN